MPVLVCAGAYDGIAPPENSRAIVWPRVPSARYDAEFEGGYARSTFGIRLNLRQ